MKPSKKAPTMTKTPVQCITTAYLCAVFIVLPLLLHDAYFDITHTKFAAFSILSGAYILAAAPFALKKSTAFDKTDIFALIFFALSALTSALNGVWLGESCRYQGFLSAVIYGGAFILVRRFGSFGRNERFALLLGFALCAMIAIAEFFGLDIMGTVAATPESERMRFISTVGNISFFSAMCSLLLPVPAALYLRSEKTGQKAAYMLLCVLFLTAAMVSRAESAVLGALAAAVLFPALTPEEHLRGYPPLLCVLCLWAWIFSLLAPLGAYPLSRLTQTLCSPWVLLPICVLCAVLTFLSKNVDKGKAVGVCRIYRVGLAALIGAPAVFTVLANTVFPQKLTGSAAEYFLFTDSWGTDRGLIWRKCLELYRGLPFVKKIFGAGAGSIAAWDALHPMFSDAVTDSAHNEYLTYLITGGAVGLAAYLAMLIAALRKGRGHVLAVCAAAYAVQAAVNIAQPFTTPMFLLLTALMSGEEERENEGILPAEFSVSLTVLAAAAVLVLSAAKR